MRLEAAACLLVATAAAGADLTGQARVWVGPGLDSNARRDFVSAGVPTQADAFFFGLLGLEGLWDFERGRLAGVYDVAARKFLFLPSEDTVVQSAQGEAALAVGRLWGVGLAGRLRDRRGAERDYTDLLGEAVLDFVPDAAVDVRLKGGAHRFLYWRRFAYSFFGPDASLQARYRFNRRHSLAASANVNWRTYNARATDDPEDPEPPPPRTRRDSFLAVGASYQYRGPFHLTAGYSYLDQASNSFGETLRRHRFAVTAGVRLPWRFTLLASATLQLSQFPDGVYLSPELQVVEDDENSSAVTLKLVRPLGEHLDLDLRYAVYVNVLPQNRFFYLRHVGSLGLSLAF